MTGSTFHTPTAPRTVEQVISSVRRLLAGRAPAAEVLHEIIAGAARVTSSEVAVMRRIDSTDPTRTLIVASLGHDEPLLAALRFGPSGQGVGGAAMRRRGVIVEEDYGCSPIANPLLAGTIEVAMGAPMLEFGAVVGSVVVASWQARRRYSSAERSAFESIVEQAGIVIAEERGTAVLGDRPAH